MKKKLIIINYKQGEKFWDYYGEKPLNYNFTPIKIDFDGEVKEITENHLSNVIDKVAEIWTKSAILLSNDHVVTYAGLKALNKSLVSSKIGLVVLDWHLDIYSHDYVGEYLTKATLFRVALNEGLVSHIVFVGTRPSEESCYRDIDFKIEDFSKKYSQDLRNRNIFAGLENKFSIIPSYQVDSLSKSLRKGIDILIDNGCEYLGVDIDLDVFDSKEILGVEFNKHLVNKIKTYNKSRIKEKNNLPDKSRVSEINNYVSFLENSVQEQGLSPDNIYKELSLMYEYAISKKLEFVYKGITEYEPGNDDGTTLDLIKEIIRSYEIF